MIPQGWRVISAQEKTLIAAGLAPVPANCQVMNSVTGAFNVCYFPDMGTAYHTFITTEDTPTPCVTI